MDERGGLRPAIREHTVARVCKFPNLLELVACEQVDVVCVNSKK